MHGHRDRHHTSPAREGTTTKKTTDEMLAAALEALRAVRGNYKAWRELWPDQQAKVSAAGEVIESELKRAA